MHSVQVPSSPVFGGAGSSSFVTATTATKSSTSSMWKYFSLCIWALRIGCLCIGATAFLLLFSIVFKLSNTRALFELSFHNSLKRLPILLPAAVGTLKNNNHPSLKKYDNNNKNNNNGGAGGAGDDYGDGEDLNLNLAWNTKEELDHFAHRDREQNRKNHHKLIALFGKRHAAEIDQDYYYAPEGENDVEGEEGKSNNNDRKSSEGKLQAAQSVVTFRTQSPPSQLEARTMKETVLQNKLSVNFQLAPQQQQQPQAGGGSGTRSESSASSSSTSSSNLYHRIAFPDGVEHLYIAANLHNSEDILPLWLREMKRLLLFLSDAPSPHEANSSPFNNNNNNNNNNNLPPVKKRIFLSIFTNQCKDHTNTILRHDLIPWLKVHRISFNLNLEGVVAGGFRKRPEWMERIDWLSRVRNAAMKPLWEDGTRLFYEEGNRLERIRLIARAKKRIDLAFSSSSSSASTSANSNNNNNNNNNSNDDGENAEGGEGNRADIIINSKNHHHRVEEIHNNNNNNNNNNRKKAAFDEDRALLMDDDVEDEKKIKQQAAEARKFSHASSTTTTTAATMTMATTAAPLSNAFIVDDEKVRRDREEKEAIRSAKAQEQKRQHELDQLLKSQDERKQNEKERVAHQQIKQEKERLRENPQQREKRQFKEHLEFAADFEMLAEEREARRQTQRLLSVPADEIPEISSVRVLFLNDIIFTAEDLIVLMHTRKGDYDMTCGMDFYWNFYDTWVSRDLSGKPFWSAPPFSEISSTRRELSQLEPTKVTCCWNGAIVAKAAVFLKEIRRPRQHPENEQQAVEMFSSSQNRNKNGKNHHKNSELKHERQLLVAYNDDEKKKASNNKLPIEFQDPRRFARHEQNIIFRASTSPGCPVSECLLLCRDMRRTKRGRSTSNREETNQLSSRGLENPVPFDKIYINPVVRVGYLLEDYLNHHGHSFIVDFFESTSWIFAQVNSNMVFVEHNNQKNNDIVFASVVQNLPPQLHQSASGVDKYNNNSNNKQTAATQESDSTDGDDADNCDLSTSKESEAVTRQILIEIICVAVGSILFIADGLYLIWKRNRKPNSLFSSSSSSSSSPYASSNRSFVVGSRNGSTFANGNNHSSSALSGSGAIVLKIARILTNLFRFFLSKSISCCPLLNSVLSGGKSSTNFLGNQYYYERDGGNGKDV